VNQFIADSFSVLIMIFKVTDQPNEGPIHKPQAQRDEDDDEEAA
jgi:hypothetical protein